MWSVGDARGIIARAIAAGEMLLACDTARAALREHRDVGLRQDLARALLGLGSFEEALHEARDVLADGAVSRHARRETLLLAGDVHFEAAGAEAMPENREARLAAAVDHYRDALALAADHAAALRFAVASVVLAQARQRAEVSEAEQSAEQALSALKSARAFDQLVDRAEAHCVLGRFDEASADYRAAVAIADTPVHRLAAARRRARLVAGARRALDGAEEVRDSYFDPCFPPLQLVVFSGHVVDLPGQNPPRFTAAVEGHVREMLRAKLEDLHARVSFSSAAAGADLIFIEEMLRRDAQVHVVLPWAREAFVQTSVAPFGESWVGRFEEALERAASIRTLGELHRPSDHAGYQYTNAVMGGLARLAARSLGLDLLPVALWDGFPGRPGGTADFVEFWRAQAVAPEILHLSRQPDRPAIATAPAPVAQRDTTLRQEIKTMLFADIVGYSRLPEAVIPAFVHEFMGRVSRVVAESDHGPISVNTWGDALYFVFDRAEAGGLFSLELMEMIERTDWEQHGVFWEEALDDGRRVRHPLGIRTALHTGPVFAHFDPVVRNLGYTGAHVSRAARIEPITAPGEVYASEEFAAMAAAERISGFGCHFVGTMPLAKKYPGEFRIYRLRRTQSFPIDTLGRLIHEAYCRERAAAGETPARNSSLRAWEDLPEDLRAANREQAADIPAKLRRIGYELVASSTRKAAPGAVAPDDPEFVAALRDSEEPLAVLEHDRWSEGKRRARWRKGPRDDRARQHPDLVGWDELDLPAKDKDREAVRNIPALLAAAAFRVRRLR